MAESPAPAQDELSRKIREQLDSVSEIIAARDTSYGSAEENFRVIAVFFNEILSKKLRPGECITAIDIADCMVGLKLARTITGDSPDSRKDLVGYGILGAALDEMRHNKARRYQWVPLDE